MPQSVSSTQLLADATANDGATTGVHRHDDDQPDRRRRGHDQQLPGYDHERIVHLGVGEPTPTLPSIIYVQSGTSCPSTYSASTYATNAQG